MDARHDSTSLDDQLGGWNIAHRPAPADLEAMAYIKMKTAEFSGAGLGSRASVCVS